MTDGPEHDHHDSGTDEPRGPARGRGRGAGGDAAGAEPGAAAGVPDGAGTGDARAGTVRGPGGRGPRARRPSRRKVLRWLTAAVSVLVMLVAAAGALVYVRLTGNLHDLPLFGGVSGDAGTERPDAFGRTPLNVLVIGSDTRAGRADCRLGGDCGPGRNADVEMVLHLAADRSHATALSIPRDTVMTLPACRKPGGGVAAARRGPVNSTLQYGPGCTVAAVHVLTGIPFDHFVMADFAGVVRMSDAVGGVPVCVDRDVYDPYSHLKLARGKHSLKGVAALEFLRSRHAFGDGSDLGRTDAQHLFLASLAQRMRGGGSLTDPAGLLTLADAATRSLTVDTGLASVPRLTGLADDVRKVPPARFTFTTMPSGTDPRDRNRLVVTAAARRLFAAIAGDQPLRVAGAPPSGSPGSPGDSGDRGDPGSPGDRSADETFEDRDTVPVARGRTAAGAGACAEVARDRTVAVKGVAMTPTAAFAATPRIAVSAR